MTTYGIVVVSDLHCGSTVGLCPSRGVPLDNGGHYTPSRAQRWLWERWERFVAAADLSTDYRLLLLNGDLVDGPLHHGTTESISPHPGAEVDCLALSLAPLLEIDFDAIVVVRGTESHVGKSGSVEEAFARQLIREGYPVLTDASRQTASWYHWTGEFGGIRVDATHHGRMGQMPWSRPGTVANNAAREFYAYASTKRRHPDIAIRSHYHKVGDSYDAHPIRMIQTPAWQLATAFVHRIAAAEHADIGGITLTIEEGVPDVVKHLYPPEERRTWHAPSAARPTTSSRRSTAPRNAKSAAKGSGPRKSSPSFAPATRPSLAKPSKPPSGRESTTGRSGGRPK